MKCGRGPSKPHFIHFVFNNTGKRGKERNKERRKIAVEMIWMRRAVLKTSGGWGGSDLSLGWPSTVPASSAPTGMVEVFNSWYSRPVCIC